MATYILFRNSFVAVERGIRRTSDQAQLLFHLNHLGTKSLDLLPAPPRQRQKQQQKTKKNTTLSPMETAKTQENRWVAHG